MSSLKCLSVVLVLVVWSVNEIQGSVARGPCRNAGRGQTHHRCEMNCNFDGSCTESVTQESCGCNGNAMYLQGTMNFQDGRPKSAVGQSTDPVCNNMQARCRDCRRNTGRTAYAVKTTFDNYC